MPILGDEPTAIEFPMDSEALIAQGMPSEVEVIPQADISLVESTTTIMAEVFGKDAPLMNRVSWCESRWRQFGTGGTVLRGTVVKEDIGYFQINETYHLKTSKNMGLDIYTLRGNIEFAKSLFDANKTRDWSASQSCWKNR